MEEKTCANEEVAKVSGASTRPTKSPEVLPTAILKNEICYGKPVEEVDPLVFEDTFCVITKRMKRHCIHRFSSSKSLFLMGPLNPIRKLAIYITTHRWFDIIMIFTILCNCVTLAMITNEFIQGVEDKPATKKVPKYDYYIECIEYAFLLVYATELVIKVIAKGFILNKFSYLRNRWNIVDLVVVVSGFVTALQDLFTHKTPDDFGNNELDFLRTFRVLRVVKTISIFPGLKMMINILINSIVQLLEVMGLIFVCLIIFSIFSLEVFQGKLLQKCVVDKGGPEDVDRLINQPLNTIGDVNERDRLWTEWVTDWKNWKRRMFPEKEPTQCGNDSFARYCPAGYTCIGLLGKNPDDGWTGFDNFFASMLSTFQLISSDYWERVYDVVVSTTGVWSLVFFIIIIFIGYYCLLNLLLAVVTMSYENQAQLHDQGQMTPFQRLKLKRAASTFSFDELSKLNICKLERTKSEKEMLLKKKLRNEPGKRRKAIELDDAALNLFRMHMSVKQDAVSHGTARTSVSNAEGSLAEETASLENEQKVLLHNDTLGVDKGQSPTESDVEVDKKQTQKPISCKNRASMCLKKLFVPIVNNRFFEITITICIIINTICLAMEHHGASKALEEALRLANHIFMALFTAECVLKILALQSEYLSSGWNRFDLVVVIISYLDLVWSNANTGSRGLSVIRSMRLLRVFKLANSWVTMKVLLNIIFASFGDLGSLTCLLMLVIFIFAVMGMQVVGDQYCPGAFESNKTLLKFPQWNWSNFWYAFMMVFRVLCGEWIEPMWECLKAQEYYLEQHDGSIPSFAYFKCFAIYLSILIVGNFIVFNLFLALLLNSFDTEELSAQREKQKEAGNRVGNLKRTIVNLMMTKDLDLTDGKEEYADTFVEKYVSEPTGKVPRTSGQPLNHVMESAARTRWKKAINSVIMQNRIENAERVIARSENKMQRNIPKLANKYFLKNPGLRNNSEGFQHELTPESSDVSEHITIARDCFPVYIWRSRFCPCRTGLIPKRKGVIRVSVWDKIRDWSAAIVGHPIFEYVILALILASSIALSFEDVYLDENQDLKYILCMLNVIFTGIFLMEMILKLLAIGVWSYFTSFWTLLDGFIVVVSLISLYFDFSMDDLCSRGTTSTRRMGASANLGSLKALRTLRALRPLRAISRWQSMKIVVNALVHAIPAIFNVLLVCALFWLVFSIMGVQFFKGEFYRCVDDMGGFLDPKIVPNKDVCCAKVDSHDYSWTNTISNYDNVFEGYLSLFQIATFEGWMELMSYSVDAVGVDKQPIRDFQIGYYAFYVIFIIFGAFFALQLFIGVIIDNFNMLKKKYDGSMLEVLLTPTQRNYYIAMKNLGKSGPRNVIGKPKSNFRSFFYHLALSRRLEILIFFMIFLNMGVEAFEGLHSGKFLDHSLHACKSVFTTIYVLEALIKILGLGVFYFTVPWNVYDFILVLASLLDIFLTSDLSLTVPIPPTMLRIVRVFRIGRLLRTVKAAKGFRKLLITLTISFPALCNIGALLTLITFIYAILGMSMFSKAAFRWSIDEVFSFRTFLSSNLMLFRLMTAAGWNEVLDSLTVIEPVCGNYRHIKCGLTGEPECVNRAVVVAYIISYSLLTNQIMINLFIAIILENYEDVCDEEEVGIVEDDLAMFYVRWSKYDPYATQFINLKDLSAFLDNLNPPLQVPKPNTLAIVTFNLPIARGNKIHCLDILYALIMRALGQVDDSPEFRKLQNKMEGKFEKQFPTRRLLEIVSTTRQWKIENNAAIVIQRAWRKYLKDKKIRIKLKREEQRQMEAKSKENDLVKEEEQRQMEAKSKENDLIKEEEQRQMEAKAKENELIKKEEQRPIEAKSKGNKK